MRLLAKSELYKMNVTEIQTLKKKNNTPKNWQAPTRTCGGHVPVTAGKTS